jgi:aminoglycoside phosphotransferase (APT) family kinase protein
VDLDGFAEDDIRAVWDDAVAAFEWLGPRVWVHGDLHPANVVIADGTLAGVVDFGAVFAGDPAWDLAAAWLLLPAGSAARFFDSYAQADLSIATRQTAGCEYAAAGDGRHAERHENGAWARVACSTVACSRGRSRLL